MAEDCSRIEGELDNIIAALQGHEASNQLVEVNIHNRQELAITKKFDLQPKASASGINNYLIQNKITADMIRGLDITTRNDGMLTLILVWGRVFPTVISGPQGEPGDPGPPGDDGDPGTDAQCECVVTGSILLPSSSSALVSSSSSVLGSSSSALPSSSSAALSSSSSGALSSSSSGIPLNYILDEFGDPILDEFGDPILDES